LTSKWQPDTSDRVRNCCKSRSHPARRSSALSRHHGWQRLRHGPWDRWWK
jgi:hypothetical protein